MQDGTVCFGADPGKAGAIVGLHLDASVIFGVDMPQDDTDLADLWHSIAKSYTNVHVVVEKVWSNPIWGKRHCFEFGRQKGRIEMAIASAGLDFWRITPTTWQKHFELSKTPYERAEKYKGQRVWKKRLHQLAISKFDGRVTLSQADAYLIAEYCREAVLKGDLKR